MRKADLKSMTYTELEAVIKDLGEPKFRTKQVYDWLHNKLVTEFEEMTNLSKSLRVKFEEN